MKWLLFMALFAMTATAFAQNNSFGWKGRQFLLDGKPFQIRSGEMHYARVPREYWHDRLRKLKAMGLNTVSSYMFWNAHEPEPGKFDFRGNLDVAAFVKAAQEEGLYVLLRPGPYACAEWEWGGYPYWLANIPNIKVRTTDPRFIEACRQYIKAVGKQLAPLQITHGGPILMVQVENEYGSFGHDKAYLGDIKDMIRAAGFDVPLYTVDGSNDSMLQGGTLPGVLACVNFGDDPEGNFRQLEKYRPDQPWINGEYYPGWFDQWGFPHHSSGAEQSVKDIDWMMAHGCSFNLYMVHGGWTPGFMNGANIDGGHYHPQTNSYYDDTCLDDAGRPTAKFEALQAVIKKYLPPDETLPNLPEPNPAIEVPKVTLSYLGELFDNLPVPMNSNQPLGFEELHQAYGFVLYRTTLPASGSILKIEGLQDRAQVYVDTNYIGALDRRLKQDTLYIPSGSTLDILVENLGRVNYGPQIQGERKGFISASIDGQPVKGWEMFRFPLTDGWIKNISPRVVQISKMPGRAPQKRQIVVAGSTKAGPRFYRAAFSLDSVGDTFLDTRNFSKGVIWVNGHNLGRYWNIGPQQTVYVPGPWLKKTNNVITILDLETPVSDPSVVGLRDPVWGKS